jgi:hypothetical protein
MWGSKLPWNMVLCGKIIQLRINALHLSTASHYWYSCCDRALLTSTKSLTNGRQARFSHNDSGALMMPSEPSRFHSVTLYSENLAKGDVAVTPEWKLCNRSQWAILSIWAVSLLYVKPCLLTSQWTLCVQLIKHWSTTLRWGVNFTPHAKSPHFTLDWESIPARTASLHLLTCPGSRV